MTTKKLVAIERQLLEGIPGFAVKGSLMFIPPVGKLLRGIHFGGSSFDKTSIYANMFVMPFCLPRERLNMTYGSRVRHNGVGDIWDENMENLTIKLGKAIQDYAVPYLTKIDSLPKFIEHVKINASTIRDRQALAMTLAREGRINESLEYFDQIISEYDKIIPWQFDISEEAQKLKTKLLLDPEGAAQQLEAWEMETIRNLGLESFRGDA